MGNKRGFALSFVLAIILALTILYAGLLWATGGLSRQTARYVASVQAVYDAESAIIAALSGFPDGHFAGLPHVARYGDGLWGRMCAPLEAAGDVPAGGKGIGKVHARGSGKRICAEYGTRYTRRRFDEWFAALAAYRTDLWERILSTPRLRTVSGNRRFFALDSSVALRVSGGDLLLDMDSRVPAGAFVVEGSVNVKGRARFDTLRIFADGDVRLCGDAVAARLEVYSDGSIEVCSRFRFSGMLAARREILLRDHVRAEFPSVAVAIGSGACSVTLAGHAA
ncbi:MAG: hypothetical protein IK012_02850, partial [Fibrobacter sp.]|uniref:hypothetical protein n=1 Tax=Fibrobacter sp. TaxID=35828 RepID=UPI0025C6B2FA